MVGKAEIVPVEVSRLWPVTPLVTFQTDRLGYYLNRMLSTLDTCAATGPGSDVSSSISGQAPRRNAARLLSYFWRVGGRPIDFTGTNTKRAHASFTLHSPDGGL